MGILSMTMAAILSGCRKPEQSPENTQSVDPVKITDVQELSFGLQGSSIPEITSFTLTRTEEGTCVRLENTYWEEAYEHIAEGALMEQAREILETYDVGSWNGFHRTNSMVLDGGSFYLTVTFMDGTQISASGNNSFPPNYSSVHSELSKLIEPTRKLWRDQRYPKAIEDTHIDTFSFRVYPKTGSAKFACRFEKRSDDPGRIYMQATIYNGYGPKHPDCIDYSFYGAVPEPPFEKLQEIVEKYHLAAWNGYNEFLPYEEKEQTFYLTVDYESGESIEASGSLLPDQYGEAEKEIIQVIWDYILERQDEFVPWQ